MGSSLKLYARFVGRATPTLGATALILITARYSQVNAPPPAARVSNSWPPIAFSRFYGRRGSGYLDVFASNKLGEGYRRAVGIGDMVMQNGHRGTLIPLRVPVHPQISPDGNWLVFVGYVALPNGSKSVGIIVAPIDEGPAIEADLEQRPPESTCQFIVHLRNGKSGEFGTHNSMGTIPQWSPTDVLGHGRWIAYTDWSESRASDANRPNLPSKRDLVPYLVRHDGSEIVQLVPDSAGEDHYFDLCWSPDSKRMVGTGDVEMPNKQRSSLFLLRLSISSGETLQAQIEQDLVPEGSPIHGRRIKNPAWAHRSDRIAVCVQEGADWDLWVVEPSVKVRGVPRTTRITHTHNRSEATPVWSLDDGLIYFQEEIFEENDSQEGFGCVRSDGKGSTVATSPFDQAAKQ